MTFAEMNLPKPIQIAIEALGYTVPTPIQEKAIPIIIDHKDIIGCAQTGTGKSAAFCIPMLMRLMKLPQKSALILVPTRELAMQIQDVLLKLTLRMPEIKLALLIGGMKIEPQIRSLSKKPRVIVATPGRLIDHLRRRTIYLNSTEILVLDEADRMLDMGFEPQLNQILEFLPK